MEDIWFERLLESPNQSDRNVALLSSLEPIRPWVLLIVLQTKLGNAHPEKLGEPRAE